MSEETNVPTAGQVRITIRLGNRRGPPHEDGKRGELIAERDCPAQVVPWLRTFVLMMRPAAKYDAMWVYAGDELLWSTSGTRAEVDAATQEELHRGDRDIAAQREAASVVRLELRSLEGQVASAQRSLDRLEQQEADARASLAELRAQLKAEREAADATREAFRRERAELAAIEAEERRRRLEDALAESTRIRAAIAESNALLQGNAEREFERLRRVTGAHTDELAKASQVHMANLEQIERTGSAITERVRTATIKQLEQAAASSELVEARTLREVTQSVKIHDRLDEVLSQRMAPKDDRPSPICTASAGPQRA
ncbi:hypothetical protein [Nannocystis exedens]|uniref:hypothetical protein n=1 Tax=Nannocystis exedens TaxID=54 RepID=UPI000BD58FC6|nr:hypothetical protein [Nannocystis exedens]PCC66479.1 hypothetical protein NAEX_09067 [Nannocystis exedens]